MRVTVRTLRQGWSAEIEVREKCLVGELRGACAKAAKITPASRCKLVLRGAALVDDATLAPVKPNDTVLVAARPVETTPRRSPGSGPNGRSRNDDDDADADADADANLKNALSPARLRLYDVLVRNANVPPAVALPIVSVSAATAWKVTLWVVLSQIAARLEHGPVFLLATGFYLIRANLGTRQPGEASAYSVFNGFEELPGNFNARGVDDSISGRQRR